MSQSNFRKVHEFHQAFDAVSGPLQPLLERRVAYLTEEVKETLEAVEALRAAPQDADARAHLLKELCDVLYVTYGFIEQLGWDADAAFAEVHASNMTKTAAPDGGKVQKGPNYRPAEMRRFVDAG